MLKFLLLFVVFAFFGVEESIAYWYARDLVWTEGSAIDTTVGPEDTIYCRLRNSRQKSVFDGFGPCRITVDSVTSDAKGYWRMTYGAPGMVAAKDTYFHVDVVAAAVEAKLVVTSKVHRNESSVVMTCSVPEAHEILSCTFRDPGRNIFVASRDEQKDTSYASVARPNDCTLQLLKPSHEREGMWRCAVKTTRDTSYSFLQITNSMLRPDDSTDYDYEPELQAKDIRVTGPEGGATTMFCSIDAVIRYCYYRSANGTVINISPSTSTADYEYIGNGFEAGECGIRIKNLQTSDQGDWRCNVGLINRSREVGQIIEVYVTDRTSVEHRWEATEHGRVVVMMHISNLPELEYCRFVRNDGLGFDFGDVPYEYIFNDYMSGTLYDLYGICKLTIPKPQAVDLRPWTIIAKVVGEDTERSVTTTFDSRTYTAGTSNTFAIILWCSLGTIIVFLIMASCLPKRNREWTRQRAVLIRNSFRRQPHPQHTVANLPSQHIPQAPITHHVHTDILTDLPRKV